MIDIDNWITDLTIKLKTAFEDRLLFVGLQGSYGRGEATEDSDIDAVVILDQLTIEDLKQYKTILLTMPENDKACGFISGKQEIQNWPKHELFQFANDTRSIHGSLVGLLPSIERQDMIDSVKIAVSGLYHIACHSYLHGEPQVLKELYKGAFFILQAIYYLRSDTYIGSKKELFPLLFEAEQEILAIGMNWSEYQEKILARPDQYFDAIIVWSSNVLEEKF